MKKKVTKKLYLTRETLSRLQVVGALARAPIGGGEDTVQSGGPDICYISDCNPCETTVYAGNDVALKAN